LRLPAIRKRVRRAISYYRYRRFHRSGISNGWSPDASAGKTSPSIDPAFFAVIAATSAGLSMEQLTADDNVIFALSIGGS